MSKQKQTSRMRKQSEGQAITPSSLVETTTTDPLAEILGRARSAYIAYLDAQKEVAKGYRQQQEQLQRAYKNKEKQANDTYELTIEDALKLREKNQQQADAEYEKAKEHALALYHTNLRQASEAHSNAIEQAMQVYQQSVKQALKTREQTINKAWKIFGDSHEQAWRIFTGEEYYLVPTESKTTDDIDSIMRLTSSNDPVLAQLWDNDEDAAYDNL